VTSAYWLLLGRAPDEHGREQVRRLGLGQPIESVSKALLSSAEFRLRHATLTEGSAGPAALAALEPSFARLGDDREFLADAYRILLARDPDAAGLDWHAGELRRGVARATAVWTMMASEEFEAHYRRVCPAGGRTPRDVQLCELANPAKWDNPDWMAVLKALRLPAEHRLAMHRKAYEFTQTAWGLRRLGALTEEARVLSVGAGHEALAYWLANHTAAVVATDLYQGAWQSEGALEGDMRVLSHPAEFAPFPYRRDRLRFLQMDGTRLAFADAAFDIAYSLSSIEHFGGWQGARRAVEEMVRVVRPDGYVVIATEWAVSGPPRDEVFQPDQIRALLDIPGTELVEPIDDGVWRRYEAVPVDLGTNPFETPHMLVAIDGTVFTSVIAFLRRVGA
jgi:SAM-dependent methyltransferase